MLSQIATNYVTHDYNENYTQKQTNYCNIEIMYNLLWSECSFNTKMFIRFYDRNALCISTVACSYDQINTKHKYKEQNPTSPCLMRDILWVAK